jgi:aspartate/tyrosine/aromatic aminotransferase
MFETLIQPPPDKILSLMELFRADPRAGKIDLGVGVYRDRQGQTPVLGVVKRAEAALHKAQNTKTYVGPAGDPRFVELVRDLAFGTDVPKDRIRGVQTTGGAGALRLLAGLTARARPGAAVYVPDPTWINHIPLLLDAGLEVRPYRYYDADTGRVAIDEMLNDISRMGSGDVIILHGCCHNPTGADPSPDEWDLIAQAIAKSGVLPFVDLAYQGFGDGLDEDAAATRHLARTLPEMLVAYSCSKNFGIYRERAGAAFVMGKSAAQSAIALAQLTVQSRIAYSMPPDHGAALVRDILSDPPAAAEWRADLEAMRLHVRSMRATLAAALSGLANGRFAGLERQKGMFSLLPLTQDQVVSLRENSGIYLVVDGRINLAGLAIDDIAVLKQALAGL